MIRTVFMISALVLGAMACSSQDAPPAEGTAQSESATPSGPQSFEGRGVVEAIDLEAGTVTLAHEDIPGFMNAMTMTYDVKDQAQLEHVSVGEQLEFTLVVEPDGTYFIERLGEQPR